VQTHGIFNDSALRFIFRLNDVQETMQELALAKEKCTSAWNEASKSMFLLDEQSQKIEELCDQMKELKANHSTSLLPTPVPVIAPSNANSLDDMASTESTGAISSAIVRLFVFVSFL
jgi:hypothetical protein